MTSAILDYVEKALLKSDPPQMRIGDTIDVHVSIIEGEKERVQIFNGVVIAMSGRGINATFTVRRIVANQGVERIFPLHSPRVIKVETRRHGKVRRAKLYYLRDRIGKARRLKERRVVSTKRSTAHGKQSDNNHKTPAASAPPESMKAVQVAGEPA